MTAAWSSRAGSRSSPAAPAESAGRWPGASSRRARAASWSPTSRAPIPGRWPPRWATAPSASPATSAIRRPWGRSWRAPRRRSARWTCSARTRASRSASASRTTRPSGTLAFGVNIRSHIHAAKALVPGWVERGDGYFLTTASAAGLLTQIGSAPYAVTKHAAVAFAEWLSVTYGARGDPRELPVPDGGQHGDAQRGRRRRRRRDGRRRGPRGRRRGRARAGGRRRRSRRCARSASSCCRTRRC